MTRRNKYIPLTHERLLELVEYDPYTGYFHNRKMRSPTALKGQISGTSRPDVEGRLHISLQGKTYSKQRLAFFYMKGKWSDKYIDHINGVRNDNRWDNLREANESQSAANRKCSNKLGIKGVHRTKYGKYEVNVNVNGKQRNMGTYADLRDATFVSRKCAEDFHEGYARRSAYGLSDDDNPRSYL